MARLLLIFILVPLVEMALLIEVGRRIGTLATLALVVGTGVLGASLARGQGLRVLARLRAQVEQGQLPASELVDGVIILFAAALLVTPGILTDALGFFCLLPACRGVLKQGLRRRFEQAVRAQGVRLSVSLGDLEDLAGGGPVHGRDREHR